MNLIHLKYFIKLAELEHYTKSAKELNITQPSLSHAISTLESTINAKLFEKKGRNVVLTRTGKTFYNIIKNAVDEIDESLLYIQKIQKGEGQVNIGFPSELGQYTVPLLCSEFKKNNHQKNINFNFLNYEDDKLIAGLENNEFDVILTTKKINNISIKFIPIAIKNFVLIVSNNNKLAQKREVSINEILDEKLITLSSKNPISNKINLLFENSNLSPKYTYSVDNESSILGLVDQNFGISILPDSPIISNPNIKKLKLKDITNDNYIYIAFKSEELNTPIIYNFINFVTNYKFNKYNTNIK